MNYGGHVSLWKIVILWKSLIYLETSRSKEEHSLDAWYLVDAETIGSTVVLRFCDAWRKNKRG